MSLVGTRPPTVEEVAQYEEHHRTRLAIKPGMLADNSEVVYTNPEMEWINI